MVAAMSQLTIQRFGYALGADVTGLDLRQPLDAAAVASVRAAALEHLLLRFPDQNLQPEEFRAFAQRFGALRTGFGETADAKTPDFEQLTNQPVNGKPWDGYKNGSNWHTDRSHTTQPTGFIFLNCKQTPAVGGNTMFANMYMAYETLSPAMRSIVDQLWLVHDRNLGESYVPPHLPQRIRDKMREASTKRAQAFNAPVAQPAVRVHPETKRKALYVGTRVSKIVGMTDEESRPLLDFLQRHAVTYEFTYRHSWTVNDLLMWDNRCMLHMGLCDYDLENDKRTLYRSAVVGDKSGYLYTGDDNIPVHKELVTAS
jgi:taurine dioxygenase